MKYSTARAFIVLEPSSSPPAVLAELSVVTMSFESDERPYVRGLDDAEDVAATIGGTVMDREQLAREHPDALARWEAGDDGAHAEALRLQVMSTALETIGTVDAPNTRPRAEEALDYGPISIG